MWTTKADITNFPSASQPAVNRREQEITIAKIDLVAKLQRKLKRNYFK